MKNFFKEFKEFAVKGNMIDMAVGVIIGAAFKALIDAFMANIVNPLISLIPGVNNLNEALKIVITEGKPEIIKDGEVIQEAVEEVAIKFGAFISAILTFIILAFVVFLIVKAVNKARKMEEERKAKKEGPKEEEAPTTKICPFCKSEISIEATRCPHCTSKLDE